MFKKSHINLAGYLVDNLELEDVASHRRSLYIGSILPDCVPSFLTRKHRYEETFDILKEDVHKVTDDYDVSRGINSYYCLHLGVISHYLADYFTYPHNTIFEGGLKAHCAYETRLKKVFYQYVHSDEAKASAQSHLRFETTDVLFDFIARTHDQYLAAVRQIRVDCEYIVSLVYQVIDAIVNYFEVRMQMQVLPA